jgi:hypothetical protein
MSKVKAFALAVALASSSAALADKPQCPQREAGQAYPWQSGFMKGDRYAWVVVTVDRTGRPLKCGIGDNNIPDPDARFLLCRAFSEDWRGPPAQAGDPEVRTIKRQFTMLGYEHQMADKKARKLWFRQHPDERPECYPE